MINKNFQRIPELNEDQLRSLVDSYVVRHNISEQGSKDLIKMIGVLQKFEISRVKIKSVRKSHITSAKDGDDYYSIGMFAEKIPILSEKLLNNSKVVSIALYTDGINAFGTVQKSIWPIFGVLTDLPYKSRFKPQNIIIFGVFFGRNPDIQKFLQMIFEKHLNLKTGHCYITTATSQYEIVIKYLIADKPARAKLLNIQGHNAKFACCLCTIQTVNEKIDGNILK